MKRFSAIVLAVLTMLALVLGGPGGARADNELAVARPTFYIIAPGGDSGIAPIVQAVAARLQALFDATSGPNTVWVIPRLGWSPDDLYNQCANDPTKKSPSGPKIIGGIILDGTNTYASSTDSYVLWLRNWAKVTSHAQLVSCTPIGFTIPTITWVSNDINGYGSRNGFPVEVGAATALYFGSGPSGNAKSLALGASLSVFESTTGVPPVDAVDSMHSAALRAANDLIQKFAASCQTGNVDIEPLCAKLGLTPHPKPSP